MNATICLEIFERLGEAGVQPCDISSGIGALVTCATAVAAFTQYFLVNQRKRWRNLQKLCDEAIAFVPGFPVWNEPENERGNLSKMIDDIQTWVRNFARSPNRHFSLALMFLQFVPLLAGLLLLVLNVLSTKWNIWPNWPAYLLLVFSLFGCIITIITWSVMFVRLVRLRRFEREKETVQRYLWVLKSKYRVQQVDRTDG